MNHIVITKKEKLTTTNGIDIIVDSHYYPILKRQKWTYRTDKKIVVNQIGKRLAHYVLGVNQGSVKHINGDILDYREANLEHDPLKYKINSIDASGLFKKEED